MSRIVPVYSQSVQEENLFLLLTSLYRRGSDVSFSTRLSSSIMVGLSTSEYVHVKTSVLLWKLKKTRELKRVNPGRLSTIITLVSPVWTLRSLFSILYVRLSLDFSGSLVSFLIKRLFHKKD